MGKLVVIGGGWAGCAAAVAAAKKGLPVTLIERTDRLLGSGLVGGIMRNNARFTAAEELILMGSGDLIEITDSLSRHCNLDFPGHHHASLYDVNQIEHRVEKLLKQWEVELFFESRAVEVELKDKAIKAVLLASGEKVAGSVFIDASGTAGPVGNCTRYGNGCAMCIYRCPTFGPRVSIAAKSGLSEKVVLRGRGLAGYSSGSCELEPSSLADWLVDEIRCKGMLMIPLPAEFRSEEAGFLLSIKACRQYARPEYEENLILLDTGALKLMVPFFSLKKLQRLKGFERAVFKDPLGGGAGNSIRFTSVLRSNDFLMAPPIVNLLLAGERAGLMVGHTEAIVSGTLAGYNAWLLDRKREPLAFPRTLASGELIAFSRQISLKDDSDRPLITFSGGLLFENLRRRRLYTIDRELIKKRLLREGLLGIFGPVLR